MAKHSHLTKITTRAKAIYKKDSTGIKWTTAIKRASAEIHGGSPAKKKHHKKKASAKKSAKRSPAKKRKKHRRIRGL